MRPEWDLEANHGRIGSKSHSIKLDFFEGSFLALKALAITGLQED